MRPASAETARRTLPARSAFVLVLVLLGAAASSYVIGHRPSGPVQPMLAAGFVFAFFVSRLLPVRLPQGDEVRVSLMVGVSALGVLSIEIAVAAAIAAGLLEAAARFQQQPIEVTLSRGLDAVRGAAILGVLAPWQLLLHAEMERVRATELIIVYALAAGLCYAIVDLLTLAAHARLSDASGVLPTARSLARPLVSVYMVHLAMAAVALRVYPALGLRALLITLLLTLILQNSFNLYLRIRRAYGETISALARAAELDRPQDSGHAQRVADLAVAVGRELALSSHDLELVRYAGLLHDIGRIGYTADLQDMGHAGRGAEIVASIPFLSDVAPLIESHHAESAEPLGGAIVGVCSDYDRLRREYGSDQALRTLLETTSEQRREVVLAVEKVVRGSRSGAGAHV